MRRSASAAAVVALAVLASPASADRDADLDAIVAGFDARAANQITLHETNPFPAPHPGTASPAVGNAAFALAALWNDSQVDLANQRLVEIRDLALPDVYWAMGLITRCWHLFSSRGTLAPGRMSPEAQAAVEALFWDHVSAYSRVAETTCEGTWIIDDSENHDIMRRSANLLGAQALAGDPAWATRLLPDGSTVAEHHAAWTGFYLRVLQARGSHGLYVERGSPTYAKYTLQSVFNLHDFAESASVRELARDVLDLYLADLAQESLGGVRGGPKSRSYHDRSSAQGTFDGLRAYQHLLFATPPVMTQTQHPASLMPATSAYRPPKVVVDVAAFPADRGRYESVTTTAARGSRVTFPNPSSTFHYIAQLPSRLRSWTHATPGLVAGVATVHPTTTYMQIHSQNRWAGVIFAGGVDTRAYAQCVENPASPSSAYDEMSGVGDGDAFLVGRLQRSTGGPLRAYVSNDLLREETAGWVFLRDSAGPGWLALRPARGAWTWLPPEAAFPLGTWLLPDDPDAPLVFQTGLASDFADFGAFKADVLAAGLSSSGAVTTYQPLRGRELTWFGDARVPRIDGVTAVLDPLKTHDSPFVDWDVGSLTGTIRSTPAYQRSLVLDLSVPETVPRFAWVEAESALIAPPAIVDADAGASGGAAAIAPIVAGAADFAVTTEGDAVHACWLRAWSQDATGAAPWSVSIDGGASAPVGDAMAQATWTWVRAADVALAAGLHSVRVTPLTAGARIDRVVLTTDLCFVPPEAWTLPPVDTDADGLPDAWTQVTSGHATSQGADLSRPGDDPDGDGESNLDEYHAGTDPRDRTDAVLIFVTKPGGVPTVSFEARVPNGPGELGLTRTYAVRDAARPDAAFAPIAGLDTVPADGALAVLPLPIVAGTTFYRVAATLR